MNNDRTPSAAVTHAELYGTTSQELMAAAIEFAKGVQPAFRVDEVARMYLAVGAWLAAAAVGTGGAAFILRQLADGLEAGAPTAN